MSSIGNLSAGLRPVLPHRSAIKLAAATMVAAMSMAGVAACASNESSSSPDPSAVPDGPTPGLPPGDLSHGADNFYTSDRVTKTDVTFPNQYGMDIAGHLFVPNDAEGATPLPAIVVGHPMGAVKEQSADLYATKLAEYGFVTLSVDLPYWGASAGEPRNLVAPEIYSETFSAATDYLRIQDSVDPEEVGALGICGSGSYVISAAKIDPRIKSVATVSMYDMGAATRNGLRHSVTLDQRKQMLAEAAEQRDIEFRGGAPLYTSGTPEEITPESDPVAREFFDFYRTARGHRPNTSTMPRLSSNTKLVNFYPFNDIETISPRPMMFITGANAHSREFSEDAYRRAAEPKELVVIPGAGHVDLYDRTELIPFDRLAEFFRDSLNQTE